MQGSMDQGYYRKTLDHVSMTLMTAKLHSGPREAAFWSTRKLIGHATLATSAFFWCRVPLPSSKAMPVILTDEEYVFQRPAPRL